MLHLVKHSPSNTNSLALCLSYINQGDSILLLEDAVIAAIEGLQWQKKLQQTGAQVFALKDDVIARGLSKNIAASVALIDMNDFVELTEINKNILSW